MNDHALEVLEFERVLERVAQRAASEPGRARTRSLRPSTDPTSIERELDRVTAVQRFVEDRSKHGGVCADATLRCYDACKI